MSDKAEAPVEAQGYPFRWGKEGEAQRVPVNPFQAYVCAEQRELITARTVLFALDDAEVVGQPSRDLAALFEHAAGWLRLNPEACPIAVAYTPDDEVRPQLYLTVEGWR